MKREEAYRRQEQLENYLKEMATGAMDETALQEMASKLKVLYSIGFRHTYSKFYPLIVEIFDETNEYNADFLSDNLEQVREIVEKDYFENEEESNRQFVGLYKPLTKLADHINLEIGRHNQSMVRENRLKDLEKKNEQLQNQLRVAQDKLDDANNSLTQNTAILQSDITSTKDDLKKAQQEYVAILGIFAAVVLAFTSSTAFSTSVLGSIASSSFYRISALVLIVGAVLINALFVLFYCIFRIVRPDDKSIIQPMVIANIVVFVLCLVIFCCWFRGTIEKRNDRVYNRLDTFDTSIVDITRETTIPDMIDADIKGKR